ncbi:MAG: amidase domain-containing protein [Pseudonocardiaceae bacterium]
MAQLRDANVQVWRDAATGWSNFANDAQWAAEDIRTQGAGKLTDAWKDQVGQAAYDVLSKIADKYECAADSMKGAQMALDGLAEAVEVAQRELTSALTLVQWPILLNDDGTVHIDANDQGCESDWDRIQRVATTVQNLVHDAVEAANQADAEAARIFKEITDGVNITNKGDANNDPETALGLQQDASTAQVDMIHLSLPAGQSPAVVAAWWNGLSDKEKKQLELAVPTELMDLQGIPDDVKTGLRGEDDGYDRMVLVKFALDHANDTSIDKYGEDCTQFVSTALKNAGVNESWSDIFSSSPEWHSGDTGFVAWLSGAEASRSWINAQDSHDFFLTHGGTEVQRVDAEPGDIVYFRDDAGNIYHSAIITSVTPDGDVKYTQHSPGRADYSLDARAETIQDQQGSNKVSIVRFRPDWH